MVCGKHMVAYHRQCQLRRLKLRHSAQLHIDVPVYEYQTSWIPDAIAEVGFFVRLKEEDGTWEEAWEVMEVYDKLPTATVIERRMDYKNMKKRTDI